MPKNEEKRKQNSKTIKEIEIERSSSSIQPTVSLGEKITKTEEIIIPESNGKPIMEYKNLVKNDPPVSMTNIENLTEEFLYNKKILERLYPIRKIYEHDFNLSDYDWNQYNMSEIPKKVKMNLYNECMKSKLEDMKKCYINLEIDKIFKTLALSSTTLLGIFILKNQSSEYVKFFKERVNTQQQYLQTLN